jgi:hypothetical protein
MFVENPTIRLFVVIAVITCWVVVSVVTLLALRRRSVLPLQGILWALLIILVPFLGALGFWIVKPGLDPFEGAH